MWLGAKLGSNNTAELSAICEALLWLRDYAPSAAAVVRYDSEYAANIASGRFKAHKNVELARRARELYAEVASTRQLRFEH
eukprot:1125168-Pleurochrysis_carterae.AAC.1